MEETEVLIQPKRKESPIHGVLDQIRNKSDHRDNRNKHNYYQEDLIDGINTDITPKSPLQDNPLFKKLKEKEQNKKEDKKENTLTDLLEDKEDGKKKLGKASALIAQIRREVDSKSSKDLESSNKIDSRGKTESHNTNNTNKLSERSLQRLDKQEDNSISNNNPMSPQQ